MGSITCQDWEQVATRFGRFHDAELQGLRLECGVDSDSYDAVVVLRALDQQSNDWILVKLRLLEVTLLRFQFDPMSDYRFIRFEVNVGWASDSVILELGDTCEIKPTISDLLASEKVLVGKALVVDVHPHRT